MYYIIDRLENIIAENKSKYELELLLKDWDPEEKTVDELKIINDNNDIKEYEGE